MRRISGGSGRAVHSELYDMYMRSPQWKAMRERRKAIDGGVCVMCQRPERTCKRGFQTHHVSYERLGQEDVWNDLVTLCPACHIKLHRFLNRRKQA